MIAVHTYTHIHAHTLTRQQRHTTSARRTHKRQPRRSLIVNSICRAHGNYSPAIMFLIILPGRRGCSPLSRPLALMNQTTDAADDVSLNAAMRLMMTGTGVTRRMMEVLREPASGRSGKQNGARLSSWSCCELGPLELFKWKMRLLKEFTSKKTQQTF